MILFHQIKSAFGYNLRYVSLFISSINYKWASPRCYFFSPQLFVKVRLPGFEKFNMGCNLIIKNFKNLHNFLVEQNEIIIKQKIGKK